MKYEGAVTEKNGAVLVSASSVKKYLAVSFEQIKGGVLMNGKVLKGLIIGKDLYLPLKGVAEAISAKLVVDPVVRTVDIRTSKPSRPWPSGLTAGASGKEPAYPPEEASPTAAPLTDGKKGQQKSIATFSGRIDWGPYAVPSDLQAVNPPTPFVTALNPLPVSGVPVYLVNYFEEEPSYQTVTGVDGSFVFSEVKPSESEYYVICFTPIRFHGDVRRTYFDPVLSRYVDVYEPVTVTARVSWHLRIDIKEAGEYRLDLSGSNADRKYHEKLRPAHDPPGIPW